MSAAIVNDCRWAWCRLTFPDGDALLNHVRQATPVRRRDIPLLTRTEEGLGESLRLSDIMRDPSVFEYWYCLAFFLSLRVNELLFVRWYFVPTTSSVDFFTIPTSIKSSVTSKVHGWRTPTQPTIAHWQCKPNPNICFTQFTSCITKFTTNSRVTLIQLTRPTSAV